MTVDAARGFCRRMIGDESYRNAVQGATTPEERTRLATDAGFEFSTDDLEAALAELADADTVEDLLDTDEVAGFALGGLVNLRQHAIQPLYGDWAPAAFFQQQGRVELVQVTPPAQR